MKPVLNIFLMWYQSKYKVRLDTSKKVNILLSTILHTDLNQVETKLKFKIMFEKITKGSVFSDELKVYDSLGNGICYCPEGRNESEENAEFIAYCFRIQRKYKISMLEEAVKQLEILTEKFDYKNQSIYTFAMDDIDKAKAILTKIKQG